MPTPRGGQRLVDREIPDLHLGRRPTPGAVREDRDAAAARRPRDRARSMLGPEVDLILARQLVVLGHEAPAMDDLQASASPRHLDRLADQREGDRVAIRLEANEVILGDAPGLAGLQAEPGLAAGGDQLAPLAGEAVRGTLMRGAVNADVRDFDLPLAELFPEILLVDEGAPRKEVPLEVLHPRFDLALRLRAVGAAHGRLGAPLLGQPSERRIPHGPGL